MTTITYREILNSNCSLAPSQLNTLDIPNQNTLFVKKLLDRKLEFSDRGKEVGSINYIFQSTHHFIRTKGLQEDYFSPFLNSETVVAIRPQVFEDFNLKEGDLIISKDANIGEAVILDQDYPNFTISSALYKLPISKNKFYLLAFLKHHYFRNQLNLLVPKGSTIRHAKTLFLDCKIPFPNQENTNEITSYVELLTRVIINKEKIIKKKNQLIFELIEKEILENQKKGEFGNESPKFSELFSNSRLDSGYYCYDYKQKQFLISNYKYGAEVIENWGFVMRRGQNFPIKQTRKIIYSDQLQKDFYELIVPTNISEFGTVKKSKYLGTLKSYPCLRMGDIVFSIDGTIGKCIIFIDSKKKTITTGHSMILSKTKCNIEESVFVSCFLRFLRH
jgi:type I restriction enzyme S subunit